MSSSLLGKEDLGASNMDQIKLIMDARSYPLLTISSSILSSVSFILWMVWSFKHAEWFFFNGIILSIPVMSCLFAALASYFQRKFQTKYNRWHRNIPGSANVMFVSNLPYHMRERHEEIRYDLDMVISSSNKILISNILCMITVAGCNILYIFNFCFLQFKTC